MYYLGIGEGYVLFGEGEMGAISFFSGATCTGNMCVYKRGESEIEKEGVRESKLLLCPPLLH